MAYVNWTSKYSVKVDRFDADHRQLFSIINELHESMKTGRSKDVLQAVLRKLLTYTLDHFSREEGVLENRGYLKLAAHRLQHREFTDRIKSFADQHQAGTVAISVEMLDFLTQWLTRHIVGIDQQYSEFLNTRGVA